jgi:hypothetical protein
MNARWMNLFADLEGQLANELEAEEFELRGEEERLRLGRLSLRDRLDAVRSGAGGDADAAAGQLTIILISGRELRVRIATIGRDWMAGDVIEETLRHSQVIVPFTAIAGLSLAEAQVRASVRATPPDDRALTARLGVAFVLRDFARRRRAVEVVCLTGEFHGTIDRVGRDHFDLAVHEPDVARRQTAVSRFRVILFAQLVFVRVS